MRSGDIIVICQEYATLLDRGYFTYIMKNEESKKFFFLMSPGKHFMINLREGRVFETIKHIVLLNQLKVKTFIQVAVDGNFRHRFTGGFYRYGRDYDSSGGRVSPFKVMRPLNSSGVKFCDPVGDNLEYLSTFNRYVRDNTIGLYFLFPPFPAPDFEINRRPITSLRGLLKEKYGLAVLNDPAGAVFDEACFADTVNHLRPSCEKVRTERLADALIKVAP